MNDEQVVAAAFVPLVLLDTTFRFSAGRSGSLGTGTESGGAQPLLVPYFGATACLLRQGSTKSDNGQVLPASFVQLVLWLSAGSAWQPTVSSFRQPGSG